MDTHCVSSLGDTPHSRRQPRRSVSQLYSHRMFVSCCPIIFPFLLLLLLLNSNKPVSSAYCSGEADCGGQWGTYAACALRQSLALLLWSVKSMKWNETPNWLPRLATAQQRTFKQLRVSNGMNWVRKWMKEWREENEQELRMLVEGMPDVKDVYICWLNSVY